MITTVKIRVSYTFKFPSSTLYGSDGGAGFSANISRIEQNTIEYTKEFNDAENDRDLVGMILEDARSTMCRVLGWDVEIITSFNVSWDVLSAPPAPPGRTSL